MIDPARNRLKLVVGFCIIAAAVYGFSLSGGFLNWDDPTYVLSNSELRGGTGLWSIFTTFHFANYNPLHRLSYWVEWQLVGDQAWLFRLTNLLLHVGNSVLLFELLRTWLGRAGVAAIAALLFLLHPSNVETVAWISERKSLLATAFAFACTLCWLRGHRAWALALFALGMLSKTSIVPLPFLLLVLDLSMRRDWRKNVGYYAALLVPAIGLGIVQVVAVDSSGALRSLHGGGIGSHAATVVAVLPYYAFHLALPFWLTPRHAFDPASFGDPRFLAGLVLVAAIGFGWVRSWRGQRRFCAAVAWALSALLVTLVVPIPIVLADRYAYFAMPLLLGVAVDAAARWAPERKTLQLRIAGGAVAAIFGVATLLYAGAWRTSTALWTHALSHHPTDVQAWISLGAARNEDGDAPAAMRAYAQALELSPDHIEATESLANVELQAGRVRSASKRLRALLEREPERARARVMLAACLDLQGETTRAAAEFVRLHEQHGADLEVQHSIAAFLARHPERAALFSAAAPGR